MAAPQISDRDSDLKVHCDATDELEVECYILKRALGIIPSELKADARPAFNTRFREYKDQNLADSLKKCTAEESAFESDRDQLRKKYKQLNKTVPETYLTIEKYRADQGYRIDTYCKAFDVAPSGYYVWQNNPLKEKSTADEQAYKQAIDMICQKHDATYSVTYVLQELHRKGHAASYRKLKEDMEKSGIKTTSLSPSSPKEEPPYFGVLLKAAISPKWKWQKLSCGYKWEDCQPLGEYKKGKGLFGPYLVSADSSQESRYSRSYEPLQDHALFARFSDLPPTQESFLKWANVHGMLTTGEYIGDMPLLVVRKNNDSDSQGEQHSSQCVERSESLDFWLDEHRELHFFTELWEAWHNTLHTGTSNPAPSLSLISWYDCGICIKREKKLNNKEIQEKTKEKEEEKEENYFPLDIKKTSDPLVLASQALRRKIDCKLMEYPFNVILKMQKNDNFKGVLEPPSLLATMWYQLLQAVKATDQGEVRLKRCNRSQCKKWNVGKLHDSWQHHSPKRCKQAVIEIDYDPKE